jgi:hypothetical protein
MVFTLPPFNDLVNEKTDKRKKIFENNIQYNPIYNNIYNLEPRIVEDTSEKKEENISIFNLPLSVIFKNIANTLLLILIDLTNVDSYSNMKNFLKVFMIDNRMLYLGIFIIILSIYLLLFFS